MIADNVKHATDDVLAVYKALRADSNVKAEHEAELTRAIFTRLSAERIAAALDRIARGP